MKRVIRSSFGLRDQDWVDPDPEPNVVAYEDVISVPIDKTLVRVEQDGTANEDDLYGLVDSCCEPKELCDYGWEFQVIDEDELGDVLWNEIGERVSEVGVPGGSCYVSGKVDVSYSYGIVEPPVSGYGYEAELEAWDLRYYYDDSVTVDGIDVSGIVVERA